MKNVSVFLIFLAAGGVQAASAMVRPVENPSVFALAAMPLPASGTSSAADVPPPVDPASGPDEAARDNLDAQELEQPVICVIRDHTGHWGKKKPSGRKEADAEPISVELRSLRAANKACAPRYTMELDAMLPKTQALCDKRYLIEGSIYVGQVQLRLVEKSGHKFLLSKTAQIEGFTDLYLESAKYKVDVACSPASAPRRAP